MSPGKRLKLNLKPNTELRDLIAWIAAITCKQFVLPGTIASAGKTVTIIAPHRSPRRRLTSCSCMRSTRSG